MKYRGLVIATLFVFLFGGIMPGVAFARGGGHGGGGHAGAGGGHGGFRGGGFHNGFHNGGFHHGGFHRGFHHGFHRGGCCFAGAFFGGVALGAYPYWWDYPYYYGYPYPYSYPYPAYAPTVIGESPVFYESAPAAAAPVQREVAYENGKYVLYGDGVNQPWQWVWVPAAPAPPPAPPR